LVSAQYEVEILVHTFFKIALTGSSTTRGWPKMAM